MKVKSVVILMISVVASVVYAQDKTEIFSEQRTKNVSTPVPFDPVLKPEQSAGITVSKPLTEVVAVPVVITPALVVPAESDIQNIKVAPELAGQGTIKSGLISLSLKEVELGSVIRLFATLSDANIIVPMLEGEAGLVKVDVNLKDVEWKPALQAILDSQNLELYEKIPSSAVYSIRKKLPAEEAIKNTRTFIFKNADIEQATVMIKGIVGDRGEVFSYPQGNAIVVKTTQAIMDDVAQIAERIDSPRQQALIEARIMELSDEGSQERGVDLRWDKILSGSAGNSLNGALSLGSVGVPSNLLPPAGLTGVGSLTLNSSDLSIFIAALQTKGNARTVSNPKVIVANGETAKINILEKIPKLQRTLTKTSDAAGTTTTITVKQDEDGTDPDTTRKRFVEYEFGIRLAVTPTIYSEENIAVQIVPIITRLNTADTIISLVGYDDKGNEISDKYYATDEKRVDTTFMLGNKRTAVIGGLTETKNVDRERKVPLLGSIPLIRQLFTHKYSQKVQTENVIFVTVSLEDGQSFDVAKAVKQSPLTRKQIARDENNQAIDDQAIDAFKVSEAARIGEETKINDRKEQAASHDRALRKPFWNFLRP